MFLTFLLGVAALLLLLLTPRLALALRRTFGLGLMPLGYRMQGWRRPHAPPLTRGGLLHDSMIRLYSGARAKPAPLKRVLFEFREVSSGGLDLWGTHSSGALPA